MLKVLLATPVPPPEYGGIINWTRIVRNGMTGASDLQLSFVDTAVRYRGIPRMPLLSRLLFGTIQALRDSYRVYRHLKSERFDVFHVNTSGSLGTPKDIILMYIAKWYGVSSVLHFHLQKPPAEIMHRRLYWRLMRWAMSLASVVVLLDSRSQAIVQTSFPDKKTAVLPNMVELEIIDRVSSCDTAPAASDGSFTMMFVGFVVPHKGVRDLVDAWLRVSNSNLYLELIGKVQDPTFQKELEDSAAKAGAVNRLRFYGAMDHEHVLRSLMHADLFVLPSHGESAPMVVLEAMGCGKPVVSTFTGAIPEMLDIGGPQQCGICVPPRNVDALAEAIRQLAENKELRKEYGKRGRERAAANYSVPVGCSQLLDLWRSVNRNSN